MPMKQMKVKMFLFPALLSAAAAIIVLSAQQVSALGCDDNSCDSLVNIDGINIGKLGDDINKILGNDKAKLENAQSANDGENNDNNDNNDNRNNNESSEKIKIKDLNVLLDDDDNAPKIEVIPDNVTVVKLKGFKILIPNK